jgi:hypothetical protein
MTNPAVRGGMKMQKKLATILLMAGTFLCPFGYDIAFAAMMKLLGGYWTTTCVFYLLSALCFGLGYWLSYSSDKNSKNS